MFDTLLTRTKQQLAITISVVDTHEALRAVTFDAAAAADPKTQSEGLLAVASRAPLRTDWLLYDHCAAVTRLYAIFEGFIEEVVKSYLDALPDLFPVYADLPLRIRTQHRIGVAQILLKLGKEGLFGGISETTVIGGLAAGHQSQKYYLFADAYLIDPQNYRADLLNQIFGYLDFTDIWSGVENHESVRSFMLTRDQSETPKSLLKKLVEDRNLASHSSSSSVWAAAEMKAMASFLGAVTQAIVEIVFKSLITYQSKANLIGLIGTVIHVFSDNIVGIDCHGTAISKGDLVTVVQRSAAFTARIESIQEGPVALGSLHAKSGQQLGIKLDRRAALHAEIYRPQPTQVGLLETGPEIQSTDEMPEGVSPDVAGSEDGPG
jgi:MAE_28990/MAE_18760-like HEPN